MLNDQELIEGCVRQKATAQKALFNQYKSKLYSACLRYIANREDAKDILQDSFVKIYKNISNFKGNSSLETWMRRIVVNAAIDFLNKKKRIDFTELDTSVIDHKTVNDNSDFEVDSFYSKEQLYAAIDQLPESLKIIINLYYLEEFSHTEIAERLSIKEETSRTRLFRAKALMKKNIEKFNQPTIIR